MPMLFWLSMIFASALLEMNGFPPQKLKNNNPHALGMNRNDRTIAIGRKADR